MYAKPDATIEEVENTAEMANTKNFIKKKNFKWWSNTTYCNCKRFNY